jgi:hypothetical protein
LRTVGKLSALSVKAAARLGELVESRNDHTALKAVALSLDRLIALSEFQDLDRRLAALEACELPPGRACSRP